MVQILSVYGLLDGLSQPRIEELVGLIAEVVRPDE